VKTLTRREMLEGGNNDGTSWSVDAK